MFIEKCMALSILTVETVLRFRLDYICSTIMYKVHTLYDCFVIRSKGWVMSRMQNLATTAYGLDE